MTIDVTTWERAVLPELALQMTRATFDTWLRDTRGQTLDGNTLVVAVKNQYAVEWLSQRLYPVIQRTLRRISGDGWAARFVVVASPPGQPVAATPTDWSAPDYDPQMAGFFQVSNYAQMFWAPLLGRVAWRVWEIVREGDHRPPNERTEWTPTRRYTAPGLARLAPCGKQAITGCRRRAPEGTPGAQFGMLDPLQDDAGEGWFVATPGAFDRLQQEDVAQVERRGEGRKTTYWVSVRLSLPLLAPGQVGELADVLQVAHDEWLAGHGFDTKEWDDSV